MHAYLIIGKNKNNIDFEIDKLVSQLNVKLIKFEVKSIENVRSLISFVKFKISKPTAILTENIEKATVEASNAFLKNLEEPQENLYYILTSDSEYKVIPTIKSRCTLITTIPENNKDDLQNFALSILAKSKANKILEFMKIKEREEALNMTKKLTFGLHNLLINEKKEISKYKNALKSVQYTQKALELNGNVNLQLANLAINL